MKFGLESDIYADWLQFKFHQNRTTRRVSNTVYIGKNEFLPFFLVFCHVWIKNQFDSLDTWTTPWDNCDLLSKSYGGDLGRETVQDPNRIVTIVIKLWLSQYCGRQFGPFFHVFSTFWFFPDQMRWPSGPIILVIVSQSNEDSPGFFTASKTLILMEIFA